MAEKVFKTIDKQLEILCDRGLKIGNEQTAKDFLLFNNYYRISGYSLTLRDHDIFAPTASFQNIIDIYLFDHELRHILLKYIEVVEVAFKSVYAYEFAKENGGLGYLQSTYFTDPQEYLKIITKTEEQKKKRLSHEAFIKHFVEDLKQEIPIWAYIDLFSIADVSILYSISKDALKRTVASAFGLNMTEAPEIIEKFMHCLTILRNLCAHGSRLYNRLFITKPSLNSKEKRLLNRTDDGGADNSRLFGYILNLRRLLKPQDFRDFKAEVVDLSDKYSFVDMKHYGFCANWRAEL